jgi:5-methylcytosine-specific restriction endonuclease McrA
LYCKRPFSTKLGKSFCSTQCASDNDTAAKLERHKRTGVVTSCIDCGIQYCRLFKVYGSIKRCLDCQAIESERVFRALKRIARRRRKTLLRGLKYERVDDLEVLERDRWTCQLCGIRTPKRLRGSYDLKAPEVDHIVPASLGGMTSYANLQCACRRCNIKKSNNILGQFRLF